MHIPSPLPLSRLFEPFDDLDWLNEIKHDAFRALAVMEQWPYVDMHRREFTLRHTKNGESRTLPMTPEVSGVYGNVTRA